MDKQTDYATSQGGTAQYFGVTSLGSLIETDIVAQFVAERHDEYEEFCLQCQEFLTEMEKEISQQRFTYGELEEPDQADLTAIAAYHSPARSVLPIVPVALGPGIARLG